MRKLVTAGAMALGIALLPVPAAHAGSTWIVDIRATATAVKAGHKVVFSGSVRPRGAAAGQRVLLQEKFKPGARWKTQKRTEISARGKYLMTDKPSLNTRHAYRVVMPATNQHAKGVSATITVTVYAWQYLADMPTANRDRMTSGTVNINGKSFDHSVYSYYAYAGETTYAEYNLDHKCTKVRATFGISDASTTGGQAAVDLLSDGSNVYSHTFDLGQKEAKAVGLAKPLKLRLESTSTGGDGTSGLGAFASAQVLCTR